MRNSTLLKTLAKVCLAFIFSLVFYQASGALRLGPKELNDYYNFSFIYRAGAVGIFWALLVRTHKDPIVGALGSGVSVLAGALLVQSFSPHPHEIYGNAFLRVLILEIALASLTGLASWFVLKYFNKKVTAFASLAVIIALVGTSFLQMSTYYTRPNTTQYTMSQTNVHLSQLKYDGFDYAETLGRMNYFHQGYYEAYKAAWAGDDRVKPFSSIMFFRPSGMPTLYALLPGKSLYSVFLWFGALLAASVAAAYMLFKRYMNEGFSFIAAMIMGSVMLTYGCMNAYSFSWTMAETSACLVLICALSFLVYRKWWPAIALFVLAAATREFTLMLLPIPFIYALLATEKGERKKALWPLVSMAGGVIAFYIFHYFTAPVADAGTGTKFNFLSTWFSGSLDAYKDYLTYRLKEVWISQKILYLLPFFSLLGAWAIKGREKFIWLYLAITLSLFYALMGQNAFQGYWGAFGVPLLIACALMTASFFGKDDEAGDTKKLRG